MNLNPYKKQNDEADYSQLKTKIFRQALGLLATAFFIVFLVYQLFWSNRGGDAVVAILQRLFGYSWYEAANLYHRVFRSNAVLIWIGATLVTFFILFRFFLSWLIRYFNAVIGGIDELLQDEEKEIILPPEMLAVEKRLNAVHQTLKTRTLEAKLEEQRKNDLVMYLAHDIRTPLTSVIGYLSLLDEVPEMPPAQKEKYVHISLNKAQRLDQLVGEFFEVTRYNFRQIPLQKEKVDLYYMLVQMTDEFYPILNAHNNTITLSAAEDLVVNADPAKLARVFNNILKNAIAYSDPGSVITVSAQIREKNVCIEFGNHGLTIPQEKLDVIFEKFFRLDEARASDSGGAGLGLAIAKEIITLHGGTISAASEAGLTTFRVLLPAMEGALS